VTGNRFSDYYPGNAYVDYVGTDGFNFSNPWQTFAQTFDAAVAQLQTYGKPIYIFSTASVASTQKAAWITDGLGTHIKTYANVAGWVWFNQNDGTNNFLVNSDANSLAAFKAVLP
jgi:mannan endo-1,4-beta-mannosidase